MLYWIFYYIVKVASAVFLPIRVYGKENLPKERSYIIACNHLSYLDPPLIGISLTRQISYMARDSLFRNRMLSFIIRKGNAFPVKRKSADIGALKEAIRWLRSGYPLLMFPQGSRESIGGAEKLESGLGFLAVKSKVPVVPVRIFGSDRALPPGCKWVKRVPIAVVYGQPLNFSKDDPYLEISARVMKAIRQIRLLQ